MLSTGLLTTDDLDEIGGTFKDQPLNVAADLVDAVNRGLVANQADIGYALMLAAELTERAGDLQAAEVLAARAAQAHRAQGEPDDLAQAFHAELLLRLGREDEGMAEFTALRPRLAEDAGVVSYISESLEKGGHAETAAQWLTEALVTALHRREELASHRHRPAYQRAAETAFHLAQERHRIRRELGLPHDEYDDLSDRLMEALDDSLGAEKPDGRTVVLLFWPQREFDRLLLRWPKFADEYGDTWNKYRTMLESTLVRWSESSHHRLGLLTGSVDELATYVDRGGYDPTDSAARRDYVQQLAGDRLVKSWPPSPNRACWCGSEQRYKNCCLPRAKPDHPDPRISGTCQSERHRGTLTTRHE
jgi:hypothetical protein